MVNNKIETTARRRKATRSDTDDTPRGRSKTREDVDDAEGKDPATGSGSESDEREQDEEEEEEQETEENDEMVTPGQIDIQHFQNMNGFAELIADTILHPSNAKNVAIVLPSRRTVLAFMSVLRDRVRRTILRANKGKKDKVLPKIQSCDNVSLVLETDTFVHLHQADAPMNLKTSLKEKMDILAVHVDALKYKKACETLQDHDVFSSDNFGLLLVYFSSGAGNLVRSRIGQPAISPTISWIKRFRWGLRGCLALSALLFILVSVYYTLLGS
jgi:hypothetical protein